MTLPESVWLILPGVAVLLMAAAAGFWIGRFRLRRSAPARTKDRAEIDRAALVVADLENVAVRLRKALKNHGSAVRKFASKLSRYERQASVSRHDLCDQVDEMVKPAMRLTAEISQAYADLQQQMAHLSTFAELRIDPLTGVANRLALDEVLSRLLADQARNGGTLSVALVDIDYFKQINNARSLLQGDRVLTDLAQLLRNSVRQCDHVARYGGEEFVVVMPNTEPCLASDLAEQLRVTVQKEMPITVSIGVGGSTHGDTPATLYRRIDAALAQAKGAGRNCVYLHEGTVGRVVGVKDRPCDKSASQAAAVSPSAATATITKTAIAIPRAAFASNSAATVASAAASSQSISPSSAGDESQFAHSDH